MAGLDRGGEGRAESEQARIIALNAVLDRGYGKAAQVLSGEGGEGAVPVQASIEVTFVGTGKTDKG